MASAMDLTSLEKDPRLFLYTSLTAGSSHIITATSRMETILKANKIPFQAIDTATDEKARRLWQRRAGKRKLPGLVKEGWVIGDFTEVEDWNEFGELKENIGPVPAHNSAPAGGQVGVNIAPPLSSNPPFTHGTTVKVTRPLVNKSPQPVFDKTKAIALPGAEEIAARHKAAAAAAASQKASKVETPTAPAIVEAVKVETPTSSAADTEKRTDPAKEVNETHPSIDHLSAPASQIHSGTATPAQPEQEPSVPATADKLQSSDAVEAPSVDMKENESEKQLQETAGRNEGEDLEKGDNASKAVAKDDTVSKEVADLSVKDEIVEPQQQDAKDPAAAGKSIEEGEEESDTAAKGAAGSSIDEESVVQQRQDVKDPAAAGTSIEKDQEEDGVAAQGVAGLKVDEESAEPQKQDAKDPAAAAESIGD